MLYNSSIKQCDNSKIKYVTELQAIKYLRIYISQGRFGKYDCTVYHCVDCNHWHIGHAKKSIQSLIKS